MKLNISKTLRVTLILMLACAAVYFAVQLGVQFWFQKQYAPKQELASRAKILLVWRRGGGEAETIARLKIAAKKLGIDLRVASTYRRAAIRYFIKDPVREAVRIFKPDFILAIQPDFRYHHGVPNYMTLTLGEQVYIKNTAQQEPKLIQPALIEFDALLPTFANIAALQKIYAANDKQYFGFPWYPSVYVTNMVPALPQKLLYSGGFRWDSTRSSAKYATVFQQLDKTGYFEVSGDPHKWRDTPNSIIGYIPGDGKAMIQAIHTAGVALVLHHKAHIDGNAPTSRIFEAAAANAVIISDRHPFVIENFADNVLYIDVTADAATIFQQIDDHMRWISTHTAQAQQMAANCHKINNEKFSLEIMLQRLLAMHQQYLASK